jgi:hypothetical protein
MVGVASYWTSKLLLVVLVVTSTTTDSVVVALKCASGWTVGVIQDIPDDWVNDGYCDCPLDGADEPDTDACSGSQSWPGVGTSKERYVGVHWNIPWLREILYYFPSLPLLSHR